MKLWSILFTLLTIFFLTPAPTAKADSGCHSRVSYCGNCGESVRWVYRFVGYDCHGCPIYRWVRLPHTCCEHRYHSAPSYHRHDHCDSGWSFRFGFRR